MESKGGTFLKSSAACSAAVQEARTTVRQVLLVADNLIAEFGCLLLSVSSPWATSSMVHVGKEDALPKISGR